MAKGAKDAKVSNDIGRYFPPEYRNSGEPTKTTDVFSMGAIFYLLVTGVEPPDAVIAALRRIAAENQPHSHGYMPNAGYPEVRATLARRLAGP